MKKLTILGLVFLVGLSLCADVFSAETGNDGSWHTVGKDVEETVKDAGTAAHQTLQETKEKGKDILHQAKDQGKEALQSGKEQSKGFWQRFKDGFFDLYRKAKTGIHNATEPESSPSKPQEQAPR